MTQGYRNWPNFFLGLLVAVISFLGLPASWKTVILVSLGLLVAFFALAPRPPHKLFNEKGN
jgi:hypothetical protein